MLNDPDATPRRYQDEVPAVARAVRALELLAGSSAQTLAELSRALGIGASSLLAILTTLRRAGLVTRDERGCYQVGPGLAGLGAAAAQRVGIFERFAVIAEDLVERLGESALLWVQHEDGFILAAAREGTLPLRFVPVPGARRAASETTLSLLAEGAEIVEEELLPGVYSVAVALPSPRDGCFAALALTGPLERLRAPAVRAALLAAADRPADPPVTTPLSAPRTPDGQWGPSGPIDASELDDFLRQSLVATLSYLADDGYPATVPLWYAWDGTAFWLAPRPGSEWAEHVRLAPRVSLAVSESAPPLRRVLARGQVAEVDDPTGERWAIVEAQLAARYAGFDAAREPHLGGRRRLLRLEPEHLIAWRGLLRHPNLPPLPDEPGAAPWRQLG
jgi:DNA-binding IclR family transcriptional regulator